MDRKELRTQRALGGYVVIKERVGECSTAVVGVRDGIMSTAGGYRQIRESRLVVAGENRKDLICRPIPVLYRRRESREFGIPVSWAPAELKLSKIRYTMAALVRLLLLGSGGALRCHGGEAWPGSVIVHRHTLCFLIGKLQHQNQALETFCFEVCMPQMLTWHIHWSATWLKPGHSFPGSF